MSSGVEFEWTVRFGDMLTVGGALIVAIGIAYRRGRAEMRVSDLTAVLKEDITDMKNEIKKLADVIVTQAVQNSRLDSQGQRITRVENTIEDLRRGRGWITESRKSVDGEYP